MPVAKENSQRSVSLGLLAVAALCIVGCRTPVGVDVVDEQTVQRTLTANVLSTGAPSEDARQVLLRLGLSARFRADPEAALAELHRDAVADMDLDDLFALAELSFFHARRESSRAHFLAASLYAYAFLFPEDGSPPPDRVDPRLRTAVDLYNRAVANAIVDTSGAVSFREGVFPFHLGEFELAVDEDGFRWADHRLTNFVSAAALAVRGLRNRYRRRGIGAPFVARLAPETGVSVQIENARLKENVAVPVTFFVRFVDARGALRSGNVEATLELYSESERLAIEVAGRRVPLEYETTSALAYSLESSELWAFGPQGFRRGDALGDRDGLFMTRPYVRGRVPVVLIHGTVSSPARWAELLNEMDADPRISAKYQFWLFQYSTGNPILHSARLLRRSLRRVVAELDAEGRDAALRQMVLVGHSQGGLLAKLMVIESGDHFWNNVTDRSFGELAPEMSPETRVLLQEGLFFEPLPFVRDAVFIATPQRGSFVAGRWLGRLGSSLFTAPSELVAVATDFTRASVEVASSAVDAATTGRSEAERTRRRVNRISSSIDDMDPRAPFIRTLADIRVDPRVRAHSIIPVRGGPPPDGQHDGMVYYESAQLPEAVSEYVVFHSQHSTQGDPLTIREVRRILLDAR